MKSKFLIVLAFLIVASSCVTKIADLKSNPLKYANTTVSVNGEITKLIKIPFTDYRFYEIKDNTDNIIVFSLNDRNKGDIITIKAEVIVYDSSNHKQSTEKIMESISNFLVDNGIESKSSDKIISTLTNGAIELLSNIEKTYFLIEESNGK